MVRGYVVDLGIEVGTACPYALRATMASNALDHGADIAKVE